MGTGDIAASVIRFEVLGRLGCGGMATVERVRDRATGGSLARTPAAKLGGAQVVRVDSSDAQQGAYGAMPEIVSQLLTAQPDLVRTAAKRDLPVLAHGLPELIAASPAELTNFEDPQQLRPAIQAGLLCFLLAIAQRHPLVVGVDDIHAIDEPSRALLALLASRGNTPWY